MAAGRTRGGVGFLACLLIIVCAYSGIEALYVERFPLNVDEIQSAAVLRALVDQVPYRDFVPYKTVLGYYFQLPFLLLHEDPWTSMLVCKLGMAAITALALLVAGVMLARSFSRGSVLLALALLICMSTFLERSAELRVDMLTGLAGLFGLLHLLRRQNVAAGIWCAISFLISQKGIYYILATNAVFAWLLIIAEDKRIVARAMALFNTTIAVVVMAYAIGWSLTADLPAVLGAMFLDPQRQAFGELYYIRDRFWRQVITRDPFHVLLTLASLFLMAWLRKRGTSSAEANILFPYATALFALGVWHQQPWPYYFVILIPTAFVLHTFLFDWLRRNVVLERSRGIQLVILVVLLGVATPLLRLRSNLQRDNELQRETIALARAVLGPDDEYLAGLRMVPERQHAVPDVMGWLDTSRNLALLRRGRAAHEALVARLQRAPVKAVISSYRTEGLPRPIRAHIAREFSHWWGPVLIYAPEVACGDFTIKFDGRYQVEAHEQVSIDGRPVMPGEVVELSRGDHTASCNLPFRLHWFDPELQKRFPRGEREGEDLYPNMYSF